MTRQGSDPTQLGPNLRQARGPAPAQEAEGDCFGNGHWPMGRQIGLGNDGHEVAQDERGLGARARRGPGGLAQWDVTRGHGMGRAAAHRESWRAAATIASGARCGAIQGWSFQGLRQMQGKE